MNGSTGDLKPGKTLHPARVMVAGNCQLNPLMQWLKQSLPWTELIPLPPYHLIKSQQEIDNWIANIETSDLVFMVPLATGYRGFKSISTDEIRAIAGNKLIPYPNLHVEVFFPFWGYAKTAEGNTVTDASHPGNPHGDYQDFLSMAIYASHLTGWRIRQLRLLPWTLDGSLILQTAKESLQEMQRRLVAMGYRIDLTLLPMDTYMGFTFNHPHSSLLNVIYQSIWRDRLDMDPSQFTPLTSEPFDKENILPIPDFIVEALSRLDGSLRERKLTRESCSTSTYERKMQEIFAYYSRHEEIVKINYKHPKSILARRFLRSHFSLFQ